ncbi:lysine N(6)-hydroxylase/L-ornithine N(5)-oxygenase family protein [Sinomicrobium weinanense]|uniref:SidA/IucD/PvdA family monooxygenase n=1 Tax=Sinomicrobium weinanense TaxID=2842200 RepID=A0A926Q239_9FLAO|nr:SidA/IucD/PvdA family monooxygenase [Sinomicrobium weinanense]MBC9794516.1 SidA/IucD/PvdA family monooxygenase [Sinomicrobium weinanense]MBU3124423.1 SidA/IucD/PvdA family monooxygenase [Sinomicrobium weinanense]
MKNKDKYDIIGIGTGPFNLGLAALMHPVKDVSALFLDRAEGFNWHPGMLLSDSRLQVPFLADLVTLADPTSEFSFLNYAKHHKKIYSFYIRENFFLLRNEYNMYCQWVAERLPAIRFGNEVREVLYNNTEKCYEVVSQCTSTGEAKARYAKKLVLGTGTVPFVPKGCEGIRDKAIHSAAYLDHKQALQRKKSITILGSGQSAAEIYYDLLLDIDHYGYELHWITRSPRFFPLEYSKLTLEMTSPDYVDYFYALPYEKKQRLLSEQKQLYKGINTDLINDIYDLLYTKRLSAPVRTSLLTNSECRNAAYTENRFTMELYQTEQEKEYTFNTEGLILATGYTYRIPEFLEPVSDRILWNKEGKYDVGRNYTIDRDHNEIYVQNAELHTHGFVTPDLGMGAYRNSRIINSISAREIYPVEKRTAFQQFGTEHTDVFAEKLFMS